MYYSPRIEQRADAERYLTHLRAAFDTASLPFPGCQPTAHDFETFAQLGSAVHSLVRHPWCEAELTDTLRRQAVEELPFLVSQRAIALGLEIRRLLLSYLPARGESAVPAQL